MARRANIAASDDWFTNEDKSFEFTIYESDATGASPQDITGWSLSWLLKRRASDSDATAALTKTTAAGITLTDPENGVCTVTVADTDTVSMVPALYLHELKRTDAGLETVLCYGTAQLQKSIHLS